MFLLAELSSETIALYLNGAAFILGGAWAVGTIRVTLGKLDTTVGSLLGWVTKNDETTKEHTIQITRLQTENELRKKNDN